MNNEINNENQELLNQKAEIERIINQSYGQIDTRIPQSQGIADLSSEEQEFLEKQKKYKFINPAIFPETEEEKNDRIAQERINEKKKIDQIENEKYGKVDTRIPQSQGIADLSNEEIEFLETQHKHKFDGVTYPEPKFKNIENMDEDTIRIIEANVREKRENERPIKEIINSIVTNGIPENHIILKENLQEIIDRKDFIKELIEKMRDQLLDNVFLGKNNFSEDVTTKINEEVYKYLALLNSLKELGSNLNQSKIMGQHELEYVDLGLNQLMNELQIRRKNNCNIDIPIPKEYDLSNLQTRLDAIRIIYFINLELMGEKINWEKYGFIPQEKMHR